jgi:hypothetical protein
MWLSVDVFAVKITGGARAFGDEPLGAVGCHPDYVTLGHGMPIVVQSVDAASFKDKETVFHDVDLDEGKRGAGKRVSVASSSYKWVYILTWILP